MRPPSRPVGHNRKTPKHRGAKARRAATASADDRRSERCCRSGAWRLRILAGSISVPLMMPGLERPRSRPEQRFAKLRPSQRLLQCGATAADVRAAIRESEDYRVTLPDSKTKRAYRNVLGRDPDPNGNGVRKAGRVRLPWTGCRCQANRLHSVSLTMQ